MNNSQFILKIFAAVKLNPKHKGYTYLHDAVMICLKDPQKLLCITKILYPEIAKKHGVNPSTVERCIRHAIQSIHSAHTNASFISACIWYINTYSYADDIGLDMFN